MKEKRKLEEKVKSTEEQLRKVAEVLKKKQTEILGTKQLLKQILMGNLI